MRLQGDYLHSRGFTVAAPLLPGHGTTPRDLNAKRWTDWIDHLDRALTDLQQSCDQVFVAGLSGGGVMTLYLAATHVELAGAITYSAAMKLFNPLVHLVPLGKYMIRQFPLREEHLTNPEAVNHLWTYDTYPTFAVHQLRMLTSEVDRLLSHVHCPMLIVQSTLDRDVRPESADLIYRRISSEDKQLLWLNNSGHPVTIDSEWETVAKRTSEFILSRTILNEEVRER
jgi:carboxylesterase